MAWAAFSAGFGGCAGAGADDAAVWAEVAPCADADPWDAVPRLVPREAAGGEARARGPAVMTAMCASGGGVAAARKRANLRLGSQRDGRAAHALEHAK
jgi:hypothetical protein